MTPRTLRISRVRCGETAVELATLPNFLPPNWPIGQGGNFRLERTLPGSQPCVQVQDEIVCIDISGPSPQPWTLFAPAQLEATLLPPGRLQELSAQISHEALNHEIPDTAVIDVWDYSQVLPVPGGRVFALIDARISAFPGSLTGLTHWTVWWLVERGADGAITVRLGPSVEPSQVQGYPSFGEPLGIANQRLAYHAQSNSVLFFLQSPLLGGALYNLTRRGAGLGLLPLDDQSGRGEVDLLRQTDLMSTGVPSNGSYLHYGFTPCSDGRFFLSMGDAPNKMRLYELTFDPDGADLDRDGLSAAEERAHGTSDFRADSDGGGSPDGTEVIVDGTDPAVAGDDRARLTSETANWSWSELFRSRAPITRFGLTFQWQPSPFVCEKGRCYDATGAVRFDAPGDVRPAVTGDGSAVIWDDGEAVRRRFVADGREETLATRAELDALLPPADSSELAKTYIAGQDGHVYAPRQHGVLLLGDGPTRVLWSRSALATDAGLGTTGGERIGAFTVVGYDPSTDRLLAEVTSSYDHALVSFGVDVPPHVLVYGRDFPRAMLWQDPAFASHWVSLVPEVFLPRSDTGWLARWQYGAYDFRDGSSLYAGEFQFGTLVGKYSSGWDTSLFVSVGGDLAGTFEVVRLDNEIRPGDALVWSDYQPTPPGLTVSGPRGGVLQLAIDDSDDATTQALAASADLRLCRVSGQGVLWYLTTPNERGYPTKGMDIANASDATDCAFDAEGRLTWIATNPGRLGILEGDIVWELTLDVDAPRRFAVGSAPGTFRVNAGGPMLCVDWATESTREARFAAAGMTVTRGGWLVALTTGDGRLVRVPDAYACDAEPEEIGLPFADAHAVANFELVTAQLAERPDGLIDYMRTCAARSPTSTRAGA